MNHRKLKSNFDGIKDRSWLLDTLFLLFILGLLFFLLLGTRPLFVPDEGRYAEIAREMVVSGNYITPYLNGIKYFEKPILFYWLSAFAIKINGLNLWSLRSINALLALFGCLFTYMTARQLYGRIAGLFSAMILATSTLYFVMAHMISLDLSVSFFLMGCLYLFLLGTQNSQRASLYFYLAAAFAGCAVLTKGLIGIVFPAMIIGCWIVLLGRWDFIKKYGLKTALVFLVIVLPWHILVEIHNPGFSHFYFVEQHFLRYTTMEIGHYQPVWFFIPIVFLGFFPWIIFLPQTFTAVIAKIGQAREHYQTEVFLILWMTLIFLFFSFSKSKLIPYILPIFPPLAILTGQYLSQMIPQKTAQFKKILGVLFVVQYFLLILLLVMSPKLDTRTILPLAKTLKKQMRSGDEVITYNQYYQDLPFYLQRKVSILNWRNELTYGLSLQPNVDWMINDETFWYRWYGNQRVFVVISLSEYEKLKKLIPPNMIYLLGKTLTTALISNQNHTASQKNE